MVLKLRKILRTAAWGAVIMMGLLTVAHLLLIFVVNTDGMRSHIKNLAARSIPGDLDFQYLKPALLPLPHARLTKGRWSVPDKYALQMTEISLYPRFLPLLSGRLEISQLRIIDPRIDIHLPLPNVKTKQKSIPRSLPSIRDPMTALAATLAPFLRDIELEIQNGQVGIQHAGRPILDLRRIDLQISGSGSRLDIGLQSHSNLSEELTLTGDIDADRLTGRATIQVTELHTERIRSLARAYGWRDIPQMVADMEIILDISGPDEVNAAISARAPRVRLSRNGHEATLLSMDVKGKARWADGRLTADILEGSTADPAVRMNAALVWPLTKTTLPEPIRLTIRASELEMGALGARVMALAGDIPGIRQVFAIVPAAKVPEIAVTMSAQHWSDLGDVDHISGTARIVDGRVVIPGDLLSLEAVNGQIELEKGYLNGRAITASLGNSQARNAELGIDLLKGTKTFRMSTDLDADLGELPAVLKKLMGQVEGQDWLDQLPPLIGRATGRLILGDRWDRLQADLEIAEGRIRMLDGDIKVSGSISELPSSQTRAGLAISGSLGSGVAQWLGRVGGLPPDLVPREPITVAKSRLQREPTGTLRLYGDFVLGKDLAVTTELAVDSGVLRVDRLHLKDGRSNARMAFRQAGTGRQWDGNFKGRLHRTTLDRLWRNPKWLTGWVEGHIQAHVDIDTPGRSMLKGELAAKGVDLNLPGGDPIRIIDARINAQKNRLTIPLAELGWRTQHAKLSGSAVFSEKALNLKLNFSAGELDADPFIAALQGGDPSTRGKARQKGWMPPMRGRVQLTVDQMRIRGFRLTPLKAIVDLGEKGTTIDVTELQVCGLATPGSITISDTGIDLDVKLRAKDASLEDSGECLAMAKITERLEGNVDLTGRLTAHGRDRNALIRNLKGSVTVDIADGRIYNVGNAGFLTNLLSYLSVNQLVKGGMPDLRKNDFLYNSIKSRIAFRDGALQIEEGVLKSNSINIVGDGRLKLKENKVDLTLLVSPLTTVDWIVERLPIIGRILKGTLIAIPVGVKGPTADPTVIPLAPSAVGSRIGGILKRTIETPFRIIEPILPKESPPGNDSSLSSGSDKG